MRPIRKSHLNSPSQFKSVTDELSHWVEDNVLKSKGIQLERNETSEILLSFYRIKNLQKSENLGVDLDELAKWMDEYLIPRLVILPIDDEDIFRLLLFCIEITYQMFSGGTKATISSQGLRGSKRAFETILIDQFMGKLGEVFLLKYISRNFKNSKIELDWDISRDISVFRNDITNAKSIVSVKTSPALSGIWAVASKGCEYGIFIKCSFPKAIILQFFIEVCGFTRLLDFANQVIPSNDTLFSNYILGIRERIKKFKCGEIQSNLKGIVCGYFLPSDSNLIKIGEDLTYLGRVNEERHFVRIDKLNSSLKDWKSFLIDNNLLINRQNKFSI